MNLITIIKNWLADQMPEWRVVVNDQPNSIHGYIEYTGLSYTVAYIYDTKVIWNAGLTNQREELILEAHEDNFLPLLSNRLHMSSLGFRKAYESRKLNSPNN